MAQVQSKKYRAFTGILYPDSTTYDCQELLDMLGVVFEKWGYILHDRDFTADGEVKKAHYHWVGYRKAPITVKTVANSFGLRETEVEFAKRGWQACSQYLIHANDDSKYQYSIDDVVCNYDYGRTLCDEVTMEDKARGILSYIVKSSMVNMADLGQWCLDNGYWSEFIRAYPFWSKLVADKMAESDLRR